MNDSAIHRNSYRRIQDKTNTKDVQSATLRVAIVAQR